MNLTLTSPTKQKLKKGRKGIENSTTMVGCINIEYNAKANPNKGKHITIKIQFLESAEVK